MSQTSTLKGQCIAEFLGTGLLIFFGVGCVAALKVAGASFGQWEISIIWGLGVAMAIYLTAGVSGAHLNPAALPDNSVVDRLTGFAFPDNRRFTLVGNTDSGNLVGTDIGFRQYFNQR